ncbi:MAG: cupin domain-containing protein [Candidatus Omnitrophica bacterium]|nr:cupin domain-containing protein [Candidatus Omnitrophota bacterium]MDD5775375.1 cupin domain-containing protein [Candidatus Omnitrophota bacterium]
MLIRRLKDCPEFIAGDGSILRELLHADKGPFAFRYSLAHARVKPGAATAPHALKTSEVYYILEGRGRMHIGGESSVVSAGDAIVIPPRAVQYIVNTGAADLVFLCIVDPAWKKEDESIGETA